MLCVWLATAATKIFCTTLGLCPTLKDKFLSCVNMTVEQHGLVYESYAKYGSANPGENYIVNFLGS